MPKIAIPAAKMSLCSVHPYLNFQLSQLPVSAGQHDLWSNDGSNCNFDFRNEFFGVDYIGLDTSHNKILSRELRFHICKRVYFEITSIDLETDQKYV